MKKWRRERNLRWTKFSDADPTIVHLAFSSTMRGTENLRASPCARMQLLGMGYYSEPTDDQANCLGCLANEPEHEPMRGGQPHSE